jgi:hypothetical protein
LEHIRQVIWDEAAQFRWEPGDLLLVDNERMAHGRRSFRGSRSVLVAMASKSALGSQLSAGQYQ